MSLPSSRKKEDVINSIKCHHLRNSKGTFVQTRVSQVLNCTTSDMWGYECSIGGGAGVWGYLVHSRMFRSITG